MAKEPKNAAMREFGYRLSQAVKKSKHSASDVARATGRTPQAVMQWEKGETFPRLDNLLAIAKKLDVDLGWLLTGRGNQAGGGLSAVGSIGRIVPHINWKDATTTHAEKSARSKGQIHSFVDVGSEAFALCVEDESNSDDLLPGDVIVIDPAIKPCPGDMVLAVIDGQEFPLLRQFREVSATENGGLNAQFVPLNSFWGSITLTSSDKYEIVGVMAQHIRPRRR